MTKEFNITGTCIPGRHYMGDVSKKLDKIMKMISRAKLLKKFDQNFL